jgi:hypothetical protein
LAYGKNNASLVFPLAPFMLRRFTMRRLFFGIALVAIIGLPSLALAFVSSQGNTYTATYNANGIILTQVRSGTTPKKAVAVNSAQAIRDVLYLGKLCDASSAAYGAGTWSWANGGISVDFANGQSIRFPRQEIDAQKAQRFGWSIARCRL